MKYIYLFYRQLLVKIRTLKKTTILVFLIEVLFTVAFYIPLYIVELANRLYNLFDVNWSEPFRLAIVVAIYAILYLFFFGILLFNRKWDRSTTYSIFSLLHYVLLSSILYMLFASNDGQAIFLIYFYCIISAFISLPIAIIWARFTIGRCVINDH